MDLLLLKGAVTTTHSTKICSGDAGTLFSLLVAGADANFECERLFKRLPLHMGAFGGGGVDVLRALIEHGNGVNHVDRYQDTPLHCAALGNGAVSIKFLIQAEANVVHGGAVGYPFIMLARKAVWRPCVAS